MDHEDAACTSFETVWPPRENVETAGPNTFGEGRSRQLHPPACLPDPKEGQRERGVRFAGGRISRYDESRQQRAPESDPFEPFI